MKLIPKHQNGGVENFLPYIAQPQDIPSEQKLKEEASNYTAEAEEQRRKIATYLSLAGSVLPYIGMLGGPVGFGIGKGLGTIMAIPDTYYDYVDARDGKQSYWPLFWDMAGIGGLQLAGKILKTSNKVDDILAITGQVGSVASDVDQLYDVTDKIVKTIGNTPHIYSPYTGINYSTEESPKIDYVVKYKNPSVTYAVNPAREKAIENSPYHTFLPTVTVTAKGENSRIPILSDILYSIQKPQQFFTGPHNYHELDTDLQPILPYAGLMLGGPYAWGVGHILGTRLLKK